MARRLPPLAKRFAAEVVSASNFAQNIELAAVALKNSPANQLPLNLQTVELSYELSYLRIFLAWEEFLEQTFQRLLCGYAHSQGQESLLPTMTYASTISEANHRILGTRDFVLWHSPKTIIKRCRAHFTPVGHFELVVASSYATLERYSAVRHRIAHSQDHAKGEFDTVTMNLTGKRYRGSRPGRFLRAWTPSALGTPTPLRWITKISNDLVTLANQI